MTGATKAVVTGRNAEAEAEEVAEGEVAAVEEATKKVEMIVEEKIGTGAGAGMTMTTVAVEVEEGAVEEAEAEVAAEVVVAAAAVAAAVAAMKATDMTTEAGRMTMEVGHKVRHRLPWDTVGVQATHLVAMERRRRRRSLQQHL